jgi:hypothetical protein
MFPSQPDVMQDFTAPPVPSAGFYIEFVIFHDKKHIGSALNLKTSL